MAETINIFDFDQTIYHGNCSIDFFLFSITRQPKLLRFLPTVIVHAILYLIKLEDVGIFKGHFYHFIAGINDLEQLVNEFWLSHEANIKQWFLDLNHQDDVIISASAEFIILPIANKMKIKSVLATKIDLKTGKLIGPNCRGEEKVRRFKEAFPKAIVKAAYSDHKVDLPMLKLAKARFMVKGNKVLPLDTDKLY